MRLPIPAPGKLTPLQSLFVRRWRPQWVCPYRSRQVACWRGFATQNEEDKTKPFYVTTPIFYVNAAPHVGHMYTMVLADVLKRWQVLKGRKAILCTGTDEHGMKIQQAAKKADIDPLPFCDKGAEVFKNLAARIGISYDHFVRTTEPAHKEAVEYAWHLLEERGYIYQSEHKGWYSVSDETFYPESTIHLILDPRTGKKIRVSKETGSEVQQTTEQNYHFRLSAFREKLLAFYAENPAWITPPSRMKEVVMSVTAGLEDLSISRPFDRLSWGIRVPTDSSQTIYVWLDALLNYITKAGYPWAPGSEHDGGWPADVQVIGKDIVRFHCVYWPAFLMALDLPLPKRIMTHAHWTLGKQKMSKSTGVVVNPFYAIDRFSTDILRFYLMHNGGLMDDADYENKYIIERYTTDLKNGLGNLTSRILNGKGWDVAKAVQRYNDMDVFARDCLVFSTDTLEEDKLDAHKATSNSPSAYALALDKLPDTVDRFVENLEPNRAIQIMITQVYAANAFLQAQAPWILSKELRQREDHTMTPDSKLERQINCVIFLGAETVRLLGIMLQPYIPEQAKLLLDMLGVDESRRTFAYARLGADKTYGKSDFTRWQIVRLFPALENDA